MTFVKWHWTAATLALTACDPPEGALLDGATEDRTTIDLAVFDGSASDATDDRGAPTDSERDAGVSMTERDAPECDPSAHVDCFFSVQCSGGIVRQSAHAPYPCCTQEACARALQSGICWVGRHECATGACNPRRVTCDSRALYAEWNRRFQRLDLSLFCAGGGRRPGDRCAADDDCVPQVEGGSGRLRCDRDAGACTAGPRPSVAEGQPCVWDDDCGEGLRCDCDGAGAARCAVVPDAGAGHGGDSGADR